MPRTRVLLVVLVRAALLLVAVVAAGAIAARSPVALPDLALPVVVAAGLLLGPTRGALAGLGAGWLGDLVPPGSAVLGTGALLYAVVGLLAGAGRREGVSPVGWIAVVSLACAVAIHGGRVVVALLSGAPVLAQSVMTGVLLSATWCVLAVPWLVRLEQRLGRREAW